MLVRSSPLLLTLLILVISVGHFGNASITGVSAKQCESSSARSSSNLGVFVLRMLVSAVLATCVLTSNCETNFDAQLEATRSNVPFVKSPEVIYPARSIKEDVIKISNVVTAVENIKKANENTQTAKPKSIEEFTAMDNQGGDLYKNENIVPGTEELPDAPRPSAVERFQSAAKVVARNVGSRVRTAINKTSSFRDVIIPGTSAEDINANNKSQRKKEKDREEQ